MLKIPVINILFSHIDSGDVTINRSISDEMLLQFIEMLFHIPTILSHGNREIYFIYFSAFFVYKISHSQGEFLIQKYFLNLS
jgi:hypothetical protein